MIAVAVIVFVLAMITLRSWQLRRRRRLGYLVQSTWEFRLRNQIRRCFGEHTAAALAEPLLYCRCTGMCTGICTGICWATLVSSCGLHCVLTNGDQASSAAMRVPCAKTSGNLCVNHSPIMVLTALLLLACKSVMSVTALLVQACNL